MSLGRHGALLLVLCRRSIVEYFVGSVMSIVYCEFLIDDRYVKKE